MSALKIASLRRRREGCRADVPYLVHGSPGVGEDLDQLQAAGERRDPQRGPALVVHPVDKNFN